MRIIAGKYKGQNINCPKGDLVRPTTDRVREPIFSSLISIVGSFDNCNVLDCFAGSGALGFEALSRGCSHVWMFEKNYKNYKNILKNLENLKIDKDCISISCNDVTKFDFALHLKNLAFDIVFLDPPYKFTPEQVLKILINLSKNSLLSANSIVAYEHSSKNEFEKCSKLFKDSNFCLLTDKMYGDISVSYLKFKGFNNE